MGRLGSYVAVAQIEDLLNASPRVEHHCEQGIVAFPGRRRAIDGLEQRFDLARFKVFDRRVPRAALERYPQHALQLGETGGLLGDEEARKCMQRRQPSVAGGNAVVTLGLKKSQEVSNPLGGKIVEVEIFDGRRLLRRGKPQEQDDGIPIVAYRVLARTTKRGQIFAEKPLDGPAEFVGSPRSHAAPPMMR